MIQSTGDRDSGSHLRDSALAVEQLHHNSFLKQDSRSSGGAHSLLYSTLLAAVHHGCGRNALESGCIIKGKHKTQTVPYFKLVC